MQDSVYAHSMCACVREYECNLCWVMNVGICMSGDVCVIIVVVVVLVVIVEKE